MCDVCHVFCLCVCVGGGGGGGGEGYRCLVVCRQRYVMFVFSGYPTIFILYHEGLLNM